MAEGDIEAMRKVSVPKWYINSCHKIEYMFPKAHAVAYVMMAFRTAYFKLTILLAYYAKKQRFVRTDDEFDYESMCNGIERAKEEQNPFS